MKTPDQAVPVAEPDKAPVGDRAKVLLVDDRQDKLTALEAVLGGLDLDLVMAKSGKEALRLLLANEFAVILLDVSMPVMDGFETAALIRQRKSSEHTPIIFITAMSATETHVSRGYSLGAVDYIFAPVVPEMLRAKVSVFLDLFRKSREVERRADALRHEAELRAEQLESRLESLLNRLNVGVFRSTPAGDLINANPAFMRIFGINPSVNPATINLGQLYIRQQDRSELLAELRRTGRVQERHVRQHRIDHSPIWVSLSKTLVVDSKGDEFIDGMVEDVTVRKEAEIALIAKAEELARSNAELEEFAYIASHDLQEPLRMVSSYSSLLEARYGSVIDENGKMFLGQVVDSAKRMQTLIRDILTYSKLGRGSEDSLVDCNEMLERAHFNLQPLFTEANVEFHREHLPTIRGDPVLIGQVLQNLLGNAVKFRRDGVRPRVDISAKRVAEGWEFAISDNGIGIPGDCLERIFHVFHRLHGRDEYEGTGIGLAICRKAVQRHGGTIRVESTVGQGSTFYFTLPATD